MGKVKRLNRKKPLILAGGALAILAIVGFSGSQYVKTHTVDYYEVYMNGKLVGGVSSQEQVEQLVSRKQEEVKAANPNVNMVLDAGEITYQLKSAYKAKPENEATLAALEKQFTSHATGVELKVNGKLIGVVKDQKTADAVLKRVQSKYSPQPAAPKKVEVTALAYKSAAPKSDKPTTTVRSVKFVEDVSMDAAEVQPSDIATPDQVYLTLVKGTTKETKYTVQEGDCIGCIAQKFDISPQLIYERNKWIKDDEIKVGEVLDLTVLKPQVTVETIENVTEIETIEPTVQIQKNANMRAGQSKVIREGQSGKKRVTYKLVKQNGYLMSEEFVSEEVLESSVSSIIMKGTKVVLGEGTGKFSWPVMGARLTSTFGKRWGRQHKGIDLVGNKNILAADNGVIEFAGTKNGLGRCIIINHKNGFKTTYGHLSKINVKSGQTVERGERIGIMGNTGHSFGTHLHFEIHKDGAIKNPMKYL
ncbi:peptidoglycan DD-metalloendopeptidase family protein [Paenibacillus oenotherae]|nr:peptidoglycan DD-metalloendopeptidase family protein [Paenibacillus oenotherae]